MSNSVDSEQSCESELGSSTVEHQSDSPDDGMRALTRAIERLTEHVSELSTRMRISPGSTGLGSGVEIGNLELNPRNHQVLIAGEEIDLSAGEFRLMQQLVSEYPNVVSFDALNAAYHGHVATTDRNLRVYMRRLRMKLDEARTKWTGRILNVRSVGYRIAGPSG